MIGWQDEQKFSVMSFDNIKAFLFSFSETDIHVFLINITDDLTATPQEFPLSGSSFGWTHDALVTP